MKKICLCGSTKFKDDFIKIMKEETLKGNIVLSVGLFGHLEGLDMKSETKTMLDEMHLRKIDMCDEVFVINRHGYVGESTKKEIEYAQANNKNIVFLENKFCYFCKHDNGYVFECKKKVGRPYKNTLLDRINDNTYFSCSLWESK